ncbi:Detected protein of confused Function [Hibiscus syriacus]|uniref:Detected protein of confused Function n=1 Tax=Hibiscus syriacus TaxID=106335 RepID=A0A6A3BNI7_HIBSY|nr:Detected protein of confused Function [Hibiscus syriacus]
MLMRRRILMTMLIMFLIMVAMASVPWLKDSVLIGNLYKSKNAMTSNLADSELKPASTSTSTVPRDSGSDCKEGNEENGDMQKFLSFNRRETIYVRVYEGRMDLLRAIIIGPAGIPYHDGLFVFYCLFPPKYPHEPPMVYYYSGGLRLNPNLYNCGMKVRILGLKVKESPGGSIVVKDGVADPNKIVQGSSEEFKGTIPKMINVMAKEFVKNGSTDCKRFEAS